METEATPRPWIYDAAGEIRGRERKAAPLVARTVVQGIAMPRWEANAALIVAAVNQHDALVEALEAATRFLSAFQRVAAAKGQNIDATEAKTLVDKARAALDAAEAK